MSNTKKSVEAPNGSTVKLKSGEEAEFFQNKINEYKEFQSEHPADKDVITQMLYLQTLNFRYMNLLAKESDIENIENLNKLIKDNTKEIHNCTDNLRLSKKYRDADKQSLAAYITELLKRAEIFKEKGIDKPADKAISNMKKMKTLLRLWRVCDTEEKFKMGIAKFEDIFKLFQKLIDEFEELDGPLKEEQTKWWLGEDR